MSQAIELSEASMLGEATSLSLTEWYWGLTKLGSLTQYGRLIQFNSLTQ